MTSWRKHFEERIAEGRRSSKREEPRGEKSSVERGAP